MIFSFITKYPLATVLLLPLTQVNAGRGLGSIHEPGPRLNDHETALILADCSHLDYIVSGIVATAHIGIIAAPVVSSLKCPTLLLDDYTSPDDMGEQIELDRNEIHGKRISYIADTKIIEEFPLKELGMFGLPAILKAYDHATDSVASHQSYDIITHNCANFVLSMMTGLGIPIVSDHIGFVADSLMQQDEEGWVLQTLREHPIFYHLFPNFEVTPDTALMYDFVVKYVVGYMQMNGALGGLVR